LPSLRMSGAIPLPPPIFLHGVGRYFAFYLFVRRDKYYLYFHPPSKVATNNR
jgi:hypothetical protein